MPARRKHLGIAILLACALVTSSCNVWLGIDDQDRDAIGAQLRRTVARLDAAIEGLQQMFAIQGASLIGHLEAAAVIIIVNLGNVVDPLRRAVALLDEQITRLRGTLTDVAGRAASSLARQSAAIFG